jgi:hypothetical protein
LPARTPIDWRITDPAELGIYADITDPADLGIYADESRLINEINSARVDLGLRPFGAQDRGQELGL